MKCMDYLQMNISLEEIEIEIELMTNELVIE
jgi:hypothetical protein